MWPELVIVSTPILQFYPRVVKAHEPVGVQALGAEFAIETFDVAVVRRLAWPGKVEHDTLVIGPQVEITRDKFTAVIHPNSGRVTDLPTNPFKRLDRKRLADGV